MNTPSSIAEDSKLLFSVLKRNTEKHGVLFKSIIEKVSIISLNLFFFLTSFSLVYSI